MGSLHLIIYSVLCSLIYLFLFCTHVDLYINKFDIVIIAEHFNVLWKANWTREAEKVLKTFEKDVIMKVSILSHIS